MLHEVIVEKNVPKAEASLLKLPGIRKFHDNLKSDKEKEDFRRHMRKYINMWNTDCPFEVSTTNRYTITTHEAAVTARRTIKRNETIRYLCGHMVAMTPEEEKDLDFQRQDFSIVISSRKKTPSLFLGPARFANHDCHANARLVTKSNDGMEIVAVRDIQEGEEITVTYGADYFGENNCECLCLSCEKAGRNGWPALEQSAMDSGTSTPIEAEKPGAYSLRSSRANASRLSSASMTPEFSELPPPKRRKTNAAAALSPVLPKASDQQTLGTRRKLARVPSSLRNELEPINPRRRTNRQEDQSYGEGTVEEEDGHAAHLTAALIRAKGPKNKRKRTFDETSEAGPTNIHNDPGQVTVAMNKSTGIQTLPMIDVPESPRTPTNPILFATQATSGVGDPPSSVTASSSATSYSAPPNSTPATLFSTSGISTPPKLDLDLDMMDDSDSDLSDLSPTATFDDSARCIIYAPKPTTPLKPAVIRHDANEDAPSPLIPMIEAAPPSGFTEATSSSASLKPAIIRSDAAEDARSPLIPTIEAAPPPDSAESTPSSKRTPGDYIRTPLLLGEKYSRWVDCRTCNNTWVQANSYLTRKECPRCERHSKLYGYQWPKTEKAGRDDEERVMDHRTVHRFITTEEEKSIGKRDKGLVKHAEEVNENEEEEQEDKQEVVEPPKRKTRKAKTEAAEIISKAKGKRRAKSKGDSAGTASGKGKRKASPKALPKTKGKGKTKVADDKVTKKPLGRATRASARKV